MTANQSDEIADLVKDTSSIVREFPENSVQFILWEELKKYNVLKDKHQIRWYPLVIRFALSLKGYWCTVDSVWTRLWTEIRTDAQLNDNHFLL